MFDGTDGLGSFRRVFLLYLLSLSFFKIYLLQNMVRTVAILSTGSWCYWKVPQGWSQGAEDIYRERFLRPEGYLPQKKKGQASARLLRRSGVTGLQTNPRIKRGLCNQSSPGSSPRTAASCNLLRPQFPHPWAAWLWNVMVRYVEFKITHF